MPTLAEAIATLKAAKYADSQEFALNQYIEVRTNEREVILGGDRNGLVSLALYCLELAEGGQRGSHVHIDEHSVADVCDSQLVIRFWTPDDG